MLMPVLLLLILQIIPGRYKLGGAQCYLCHKTFRDNHTLRQHLVIHSGAKPFACKICPNMKFNHKSNAVKHISKLHQVDRKEALQFLETLDEGAEIAE
jgi:uncharacterized Zn-finger protein